MTSEWATYAHENFAFCYYLDGKSPYVKGEKELKFRKLANFFEEAQRRADKSAERFASENGMSIEDLKYDCDSEALEMLKEYFDNIPKDASIRYCSGLYSFLKELWQRLNQQNK